MSSNKTVWMVAGFSVLAALIVGAGFAFTAANTVPASKAGEGAGTITGYNVASVHYVLNTTDPTKVDSVTFTLDSEPVAGSAIKIRLDSTGSTWYTCTNTGVNVSCTTTAPAATATAANQLQVVVAQ